MISINPVKIVRNTLLGAGMVLGLGHVASSCSNSDNNSKSDRDSVEYVYKNLPSRVSYGRDLVYLPDQSIDTLEFSMDKLKQAYPNCIITQKDSIDEWNTKIRKIVLVDSESNIRREVEAIEGDNVFDSYYQYKIITPQSTVTYLIGEDALIRVIKTDSRTNRNTEYNYGVPSGNVNSYSEDINDSINLRTFFDNGKISYQVYQNSIEDKFQKRVFYSDGYKYKEIDDINDRVKYLLVEDLFEDFKETNMFGLSLVSENLKYDVYKRLNSENLFETLKMYNQIKKQDLIQDISNIKNPFDSKEKANLLNHIYTLAKNVSPESAENAAEYLAEMLQNLRWTFEDMSVEKYIPLINSANVGYFAKSYQEKTNSTSGVLSDINNNNKISASDKEKFISHIINAALNAGFNDKYDNFYVEDIKRDIKSHPKDLHKLDIDLRRMGNRPTARKYNSKNVVYSSPDGKINNEFCQGYSGDCWLLSGISAINNKPCGKKYLESLIKINPNSDIINVRLPGVGKEYSFHKWEADSAAYLAKGDGDIRAIEYAVDKYLKEQAYKQKNFLSTIDIIGNMSNEAFNILIGKPLNTKLYLSMPYLYEDFNSEDIIYLLGITYSGGVMGKKCFANTQECHELLSHHSYTIVMSDNSYIYLLNPHDINNTNLNSKSEYIRFLRSDFEGIVAELTAVKIPH